MKVFERFTEGARMAMSLANAEAHCFDQECIGTGHVLLGIIGEGTGAGAKVLASFVGDLSKVQLDVEKKMGGRASDKVVTGKLPQSPQTKKAVEYSIEEAMNFRHNYIGTEHMLLGLLREKGTAFEVLQNLGLELERVREEVLKLRA
ncbi:MAG: hypothetical protein MI923_23925 [Phycisphaerales bacterium]|nr:hypothetical protein [Phycisphaerales bacterium]